MKLLRYSEFVLESSSGELLHPPRNKWLKIDPLKVKALQDEFFELIQTAYSEIGGYFKIQNPSDVYQDAEWSYWEGIDIHGSPDLDLIIFGKETKYGIKFSGTGHDGTKDAKRKYLDQRGKNLHKLGYYIECSGKVAEILINKYNVPIVEDRDEVEKVLAKKVDWIGEMNGASGKGWYNRSIAGHDHAKILLGRPKV